MNNKKNKIEIREANNYFESMKRMKIPVKKKRTNKENYSHYNFESNFKPRKPLRILFYAVVIILPVLLSLNYIRFALSQYNFQSFPLDDPWIHLTFAKNLFQYFSFSYFKNEMVTAGSTSPLYTIILSLMFFVSNDEMFISYFLGILFFAASSFAFYKLCKAEFDKEIIFALLCTGIFIIDKWINFIAVSGMETTMFILVLLLCAYFYRRKSAVPFAIMLGLILWTRPDGVAFIAAIILDYIMLVIYSKKQINLILFTGSDLKKILIIFGGIVGIYFLMNYLLSGTLLPNTYNAKLTYYAPEFRSRVDFIKYEVWEYFKTGSYYVLMMGFLFSAGKLIYDIYKKTYNQNAVYIFFILALVLIYWLKLPYAHRFGRYMMPIIPFFILVSTIGFRDLARIINKYTENPLFSKSIFYIWIGVIYFIGIQNYDETKYVYSSQCKYIHERQVMAAKWIRDNTREEDVIATHDVGAIGYYSNRKIVDVAGLVTPELIDKINDQDYVKYMSKYLKDNNVTYLAFLREWYKASNQNPVYTTGRTLPPEVMNIYKFIPDQTHILSREANSLIMNAESLLGQSASQQILYIINRVNEIEPTDSYAYFLKSYAYSFVKDYANQEKCLLKAIELFPEFDDAYYNLGILYMDLKRYEESKVTLEKVLELEPNHVNASYNLNLVNGLISADTEVPPKKKYYRSY